jgi:uncharacterized membrane protein YjgN (DUF898 family)
MNDMAGATDAPDERRFGLVFHGNWREFLPIVATNFVLTIVTLGIYRFWGKARERRYLWSRTHFVDDTLEWTGTGREMLVGFLTVMLFFLPIVLALNFGIEALALRGQAELAMKLALGLYAGLFYLIQVARFRALRYQLSRTYWHGIRGGSDDRGWMYGLEALWRYALAWLSIGLLFPWAVAGLWNRRWNSMGFGSLRFAAATQFDGLMKRWLLIYLTPVFAVILLGAVFFAAMLTGAGGEGAGASTGAAVGAIGALASLVLIFLLYQLLSLSFYAAFYRKAAASTSIGDVRFLFTASTRDWVRLYLGHIGLVIATLGLGLLFIPYRNWCFRVRHLEACGHLDLERLTQSQTRAPGDAEGLAEAFDLGAV